MEQSKGTDMSINTPTLTRRRFLQAGATIPIVSFIAALQPNQSSAQAAQLTAADGYGLGTYNEGAYPAQQHNIYLPLITKGA